MGEVGAVGKVFDYEGWCQTMQKAIRDATTNKKLNMEKLRTIMLRRGLICG